MFFVRRPSPQSIARFLEQSRSLSLSYEPVGLTQRHPARYDIDDAVVTIGRGEADFERARHALVAWTQFNIGWVERFPHDASIEPGTIVAVLIRHFGCWSLNGARVVYRADGQEAGARFGYAYGTLTNHAEEGEELFEVSLNPESAEVTYRIRAVSRPHIALTRVGYPLVRLLQARFRRDSGQAMRRALTGSAP